LNIEKEKNKELAIFKEKFETRDANDNTQAEKELEELKTSLGEEKF
jgi:hypothetical protein